ncbi:polyketide cyclase/dehydrase and lipid transportsuperfamily protein [Striga asiatica]|uniref:Polyketide cyclase/dehydrase and lipid transportsuperfamily protein n=1 Tax=Striga asiatica TaxID=4170 RepID=A0A5A7P8H2_STRAF|nr:polyketide cyclase/dehydrase and lipid transportsuperfamily protein [Striga asiatica]
MAQIGKLEAKAEIKCPPAKVFNFFKYDMNKFTDMFPQIFKGAQLLEGEEGQAGNVKSFDYVLGKAMNAKAKTEAINEGERSISLSVLEGDILNLYKSFKAKISVDDGHVTWCIEFEKADESAPNPDDYAALAVEITKGLDHYLLNNIK